MVTGDPAAPRVRAVAVRDGARGGARRGRAEPGRRRRARSSTWRAVRCCRLRRRARRTRSGAASSWPGRRSATRPRSPRSPRPYAGRGRRAPGRGPGSLGGPYDPTPGAGRPLRRRLAGRGRAGPAGRAAVDRPPLRLGATREALRRAGIDATTPDPPTGDGGPPRRTAPRWARSSSGPRWTSCCATPRAPTAVERAGRGCAAASRLLAAAGMTWVQEAALSPGRRGGLPRRRGRRHAGRPGQHRAARGAGPLAGPARRVRRRPAARPPGPRSPARSSARTVKLFADGVVEAGTAAMLVAVRRRAAHLRPARVAAGRAGRRRPRPSTPTASSCTSTPSVTPGCGRRWTPSSTWPRSTVPGTGAR